MILFKNIISNISNYLFVSTNNKKNDPQILFLICSFLTMSIIFIFIGFIFYTAFPIFQKEGIGFLLNSYWSYDEHKFGIFYFLIGTIFLTIVTMLIACPLSIFTAIFLSEFSPSILTKIMRPLIELLVGIPSVIYGIFGLFVLEPILSDYVDPFIHNTLGFIPIFQDPDPSSGQGILLASIVLSIMILPTITAISQESIKSVPKEYRDASYSLGATRWETIKKCIIPIALPGILTGIILGIMRAMGETMAIVMLIGNSAKIPSSILDSGYAMTSKILNDIGYHIIVDDARAALFGIAAILFIIEIFFIGFIKIITRKRVL